MRITIKFLEARVATINALLGNDPDAKYPTPGVVILYRAYGATGVHRVCNTGGGQSDLMGGLGTVREVSNFLQGMIVALRLVKDEA